MSFQTQVCACRLLFSLYPLRWRARNERVSSRPLRKRLEENRNVRVFSHHGGRLFMASEASGISQSATSGSGALIVARQDRIPIWSLSYLFIGIIGAGFLFTFFDIFDINVSFIQTCTQIVAGCNAENAANSLTLPLLLNLSGYVVGALVLAPLADRFGRRDMLLVT